MKSIILLGGGGHCRSAIDVIEAQGTFHIAGITDQPDKVGETISGYEILATDDELSGLVSKFENCLITVGQLKSAALKMKLFNLAKEAGAQLPVIISPSATVSARAKIGEGTIVFHKSVVNSGARIGKNSIINTGAIIEHDAVVGDHCHIGPGAILNGHCSIGDRCMIGSGAVVIQGVTIGGDIVVGANSTVTKDLAEPGIYVGSPAR
jgi:sugar O-acyltransferase (sialic acid O-acetyltransferase NeuD family)